MSTSFWTALEARIAPYNLLTHPFYQAWSRGDLTRDDLSAYAAEYWHHVSAFPTYLSALHSRLPDSETRREVLPTSPRKKEQTVRRHVPTPICGWISRPAWKLSR